MVIPPLNMVFDLSDAVVRDVKGRRADATHALLKESRLGLFALLTRQARQMLIARLFFDRGEEER